MPSRELQPIDYALSVHDEDVTFGSRYERLPATRAQRGACRQYPGRAGAAVACHHLLRD
jgi:hypothetical protein